MLRDHSGMRDARKPQGYSRVGTLPVASSVLDAPSGGVPPGSPWSSGGEAAPVSTSASHAPHGAAWPPWTCRDGSLVPWPWLEGREHPWVLLAQAGCSGDVTSAQGGWHSALLPGRHPAPHAVHRALLPCQRHFELAALEILPWEEEDEGKSITAAGLGSSMGTKALTGAGEGASTTQAPRLSAQLHPGAS